MQRLIFLKQLLYLMFFSLQSQQKDVEESKDKSRVYQQGYDITDGPRFERSISHLVLTKEDVINLSADSIIGQKAPTHWENLGIKIRSSNQPNWAKDANQLHKCLVLNEKVQIPLKRQLVLKIIASCFQVSYTYEIQLEDKRKIPIKDQFEKMIISVFIVDQQVQKYKNFPRSFVPSKIQLRKNQEFQLNLNYQECCGAANLMIDYVSMDDKKLKDLDATFTFSNQGGQGMIYSIDFQKEYTKVVNVHFLTKFHYITHYYIDNQNFLALFRKRSYNQSQINVDTQSISSKDLFYWGITINQESIFKVFKFAPRRFLIILNSQFQSNHNRIILLDLQDTFVRHNTIEGVISAKILDAGIINFGQNDFLLLFSDKHLFLFRVFWTPFAVSSINFYSYQELELDVKTVKYLGYFPNENYFGVKFIYDEIIQENGTEVIKSKYQIIKFKIEDNAYKLTRHQQAITGDFQMNQEHCLINKEFFTIGPHNVTSVSGEQKFFFPVSFGDKEEQIYHDKESKFQVFDHFCMPEKNLIVLVLSSIANYSIKKLYLLKSDPFRADMRQLNNPINFSAQNIRFWSDEDGVIEIAYFDNEYSKVTVPKINGIQKFQDPGFITIKSKNSANNFSVAFKTTDSVIETNFDIIFETLPQDSLSINWVYNDYKSEEENAFKIKRLEIGNGDIVDLENKIDIDGHFMNIHLKIDQYSGGELDDGERSEAPVQLIPRLSFFSNFQMFGKSNGSFMKMFSNQQVQLLLLNIIRLQF